MIIETRDDVVRLSGSLHKNQWMTIKAAANLLLQNHPQGIIIDCGQLAEISEDGAKTFLEAIRDIEAARSRIVVANVPENIISVCRTIPGVRSQLPIADSVEDARASLRMHNRATAPVPPGGAQKRASVIVVPLLAGVDLTYGAALASRLARGRSEVRLVYLLEVTRTLPLSAPLLEAEQAARETLAQAVQYARQQSTTAVEHVERVRDACEGIIATLRASAAEMVVLGATSEPVGADGHDRFHQLVDTLLHRAPCEVIIGRMKPHE
jgi:nucleotide-binding universal stress UspA family protein/anti-anti-sigma regulatory factor